MVIATPTRPHPQTVNLKAKVKVVGGKVVGNDPPEERVVVKAENPERDVKEVKALSESGCV